MNNCTFTGRLIKDVQIDVKQGAKGNYSFGRFTIATPTRRKEEGSKYYKDVLIDFVVIGSTADFIAQYFKKGSVIEIANAEYESNVVERDGEKRYYHNFRIHEKTEVRFPVREFTNQDNNQSNNNQSNNNYSNNNASNNNKPQDNDPFSGGSSIDLSDDDLPF